MGELKPLWKRLCDHLDEKFSITPMKTKGLENDMRVFASSMIWFQGSQEATQANMLISAKKLVDDFSDSAAKPEVAQIFIDVGKEAITFLEANPE